MGMGIEKEESGVQDGVDGGETGERCYEVNAASDRVV